jgi:methionyl aminopeptidase
VIHIKKPAEIEEMKLAGKISAKALRKTGELVRPGISTLDLDRFAEEYIRMQGATPAFLGYGGFKGSICASINDAIVHGIPGEDKILQEGDIISIDTGAVIGGWVGDNAWTYAVGEIDAETQRLLEVTEQSMWAGIDQARSGNHLEDIGHTVQTVAEGAGFGVVREYVGHGVGHDMHEDPNVPNFGRKGRGPKLKAGMVIAIEPMVCAGTFRTRGPYPEEGGWTVYTADGKCAAHFERTVAIQADGAPLILTSEEW